MSKGVAKRVGKQLDDPQRKTRGVTRGDRRVCSTCGGTGSRAPADSYGYGYGLALWPCPTCGGTGARGSGRLYREVRR
jgi:DnaJ-class molecular chaperone